VLSAGTPTLHECCIGRQTPDIAATATIVAAQQIYLWLWRRL
jgi:hypothetical protein